MLLTQLARILFCPAVYCFSDHPVMSGVIARATHISNQKHFQLLVLWLN